VIVPTGLVEVQARISAVEARIATLSGAVPPRAATGASLTQPAFGQVLAKATTAEGAASSTVAGEAVVATAEQHLGVPYRWGGTDPATGLDCSGLVQLVFREHGISVPRTAAQQATVGTEVASLEQARPGDLVVLEHGTHIGIYVGDGKMLHAPKAGDVVKVSKVWETPMTIRRLVGTAGAASGPGAPGAAGVDAASWARPAALRGATDAAGGSVPVSAATARYGALFTSATQRYGLPAGLLAAVAQVESGGRADAVSPAGARGLMQIMPGTARELGVDPMVPAQAVDGAARLLARHLESFGSVPLALAAYNAGPGAVRRHDGVPPYRETQDYVRKVTDLLTRRAA
jgi:hypothetical protein